MKKTLIPLIIFSLFSCENIEKAPPESAQQIETTIPSDTVTAEEAIESANELEKEIESTKSEINDLLNDI